MFIPFLLFHFFYPTSTLSFIVLKVCFVGEEGVNSPTVTYVGVDTCVDYIFYQYNFSDGCLGSNIDEGRSEL